jgi:hypothetical protein
VNSRRRGTARRHPSATGLPRRRVVAINRELL